MFSRFKGFLNRHRRKFVIGGIIVSSAYLLTRYTRRKLRDWQERETRAFIERTKRQQHFESTERTCNQTILSLAIGLRDAVTDSLNTESIVKKLRENSNDKVALWNELKVLAIARSAALVYASAALVVTLRIQLNLIGGYMFKDSTKPTEESQINGTMQEKYLSLCQYLMDEGAAKLSTFIKEKVEESTASISLKEKLTLRDLEQIYWGIMSSVSADDTRDPIKNLTSYVLPLDCESNSDGILAKMISETVDLLESEEVRTHLRSSIRTGFVMMVDHISEYFDDVSLPSAGDSAAVPGPSSRTESEWRNAVDKPVDACYTNGYLNLNKLSMPMAKLIPIINGHVPAIPRKGDGPSVWTQHLILDDKLKTLGANVYEAFSF